MIYNTKTSILLLFTFILMTINTFAQEQVIWKLDNNTEASTTEKIKADAQKLKNLKVMGYISSGAQRTIPEGLNWPSEKTANKNRYLEYAVKSVQGKKLKIQEIKISLSLNSSSAGMANIEWSTDGVTFSNLSENIKLAAGSVPETHQFNNLNIEVPDNQTFFLRIYPWTRNPISNKYLVSKDIIIKGVF